MPSKGISKLETGSIGKLMAELCVQATFSVMLYNIYIVTDTLFVSNGVGSTASGAIGVFSPVLVFVGGISSTLGVGAGSIISRRLGEKDLTGGKTVIGCMVWVWCLCALAIMVIGLIFFNTLLGVLGCTAEIYPYAVEYGRIMLLGTICSTGFSGVMRAGGDTLYSTLQWCCPVLINMALDPVLIYGFRMGITGAALATVCAQVFSLLCSIYYFFIRNATPCKIRIRDIRWDFGTFKEILSIVGQEKYRSGKENGIFCPAVCPYLWEFGFDGAVCRSVVHNPIFFLRCRRHVGGNAGLEDYLLGNLCRRGNACHPGILPGVGAGEKGAAFINGMYFLDSSSVSVTRRNREKHFYHVVGICNQRLDSGGHGRIQLQKISEGEKRRKA